MKIRKILLAFISVACLTYIMLVAYEYWKRSIQVKTEDDYIDDIYNSPYTEGEQDAIWHLGHFKSEKGYYVLVAILNRQGPSTLSDRMDALAALEERKQPQTCFFLLPLLNDESFPQDILIESIKEACSCDQLKKINEYISTACAKTK